MTHSRTQEVERARNDTNESLRQERRKTDDSAAEAARGVAPKKNAFAGARVRTDAHLGSERDRADDLVTQYEVPFEMLVAQVSDYAIFMLDTAGNVISWNAGAERLKGYSREEILGKNVSVFYSEEDVRRGAPEEGLRAALREGRFESEGWRVRKDGTRFRADVVITPIFDPDGRLRGFGKVTRDVTAHISEAEKALARSEEQLRLAVEATSLGTWDWDLVTGEQRWSATCRRIFGLLPDEPSTYEVFLSALHPADRDAAEKAVQGALNPASSGAYDIEFRTVWRDGTVRWVASRGQVLFCSDARERRPIRFNGTVLDITSRKAAELEREQLLRNLADAVRQRDEFIAVVSHDLRGPLGTIALGAETLARQLPGDLEPARRRLETIGAEAQRAGRILELLLQEIALERGATPSRSSRRTPAHSCPRWRACSRRC